MTGRVVSEAAIFLHKVQQQLHCRIVILIDHLAQRQQVQRLVIIDIRRDPRLEFGHGGSIGHLAFENEDGRLRFAAAGGHCDTVKLLLAAGADVEDVVLADVSVAAVCGASAAGQNE